MHVQFFGTRGSLPVPGPSTVRYGGGNTSCTSVRSTDGTVVVLDMGTGAYALGQEQAASGEGHGGMVEILRLDRKIAQHQGPFDEIVVADRCPKLRQFQREVE